MNDLSLPAARRRWFLSGGPMPLGPGGASIRRAAKPCQGSWKWRLAPRAEHLAKPAARPSDPVQI